DHRYPHARWQFLQNPHRLMASAERTPKEDLLVGGLDDWADAGWALQAARLSGETEAVALRDVTLDLIAEVLREGLMVAGDVVAGGHVPWHGSAEEVAERISREWLDEWGVEVPTPGSIMWLDNTPAGDEIAHAVLAREARE
ncbi:MAG: hypothetical protein ACRCY9_09855, partial [Phycicoccus sp.]